jgi:Flp pilus assembly protein CpaB
MRTTSPYDVHKLGAQLVNARRYGATPEQVAVLQAALRVGQIEIRMRKVLDGAEPLDEEQTQYLVNLVVSMSVRRRRKIVDPMAERDDVHPDGT